MKQFPGALGSALLVAVAGLGMQPTARAQELCAVPAFSFPLDSDQLPPLFRNGHALEFSATPALQFPSRAWVMRLDRGTGHRQISLDVYVMQQRGSSCDSYEVERHWSAEISQQEYDAFNAQIEPLIAPPHDLHLSPAEQTRLSRSRGLDGTSLEVRAIRVNWKIASYLRYHTDEGRAVSAIVQAMIARVVPAGEMPSEEWYTTAEAVGP